MSDYAKAMTTRDTLVQTKLPVDPKARKEVPVASGFMDYFPDAMIAVARLSRKANERHNPGEDLHWSKGKSTDHADCMQRHFMQRGEWDAEWNESHTVEMAWRAMALLQMEIEATRAGMSYKDYIAMLQQKQKEEDALHQQTKSHSVGPSDRGIGIKYP